MQYFKFSVKYKYCKKSIIYVILRKNRIILQNMMAAISHHPVPLVIEEVFLVFLFNLHKAQYPSSSSKKGNHAFLRM